MLDVRNIVEMKIDIFHDIYYSAFNALNGTSDIFVRIDILEHLFFSL